MKRFAGLLLILALCLSFSSCITRTHTYRTAMSGSFDAGVRAPWTHEIQRNKTSKAITFQLNATNNGAGTLVIKTISKEGDWIHSVELVSGSLFTLPIRVPAGARVILELIKPTPNEGQYDFECTLVR
ncbi:MAG: hypothetical protein GY930_16365 [bacterium]|nr:hypothetical protein [bacterium]